jgi:hypothetical protein
MNGPIEVAATLTYSPCEDIAKTTPAWLADASRRTSAQGGFEFRAAYRVEVFLRWRPIDGRFTGHRTGAMLQPKGEGRLAQGNGVMSCFQAQTLSRY